MNLIFFQWTTQNHIMCKKCLKNLKVLSCFLRGNHVVRVISRGTQRFGQFRVVIPNLGYFRRISSSVKLDRFCWINFFKIKHVRGRRRGWGRLLVGGDRQQVWMFFQFGVFFPLAKIRVNSSKLNLGFYSLLVCCSKSNPGFLYILQNRICLVMCLVVRIVE